MVHLMIVGHRPPPDGSNEAIAAAIQAKLRPGAHLELCSTPASLVDLVRSVHRRAGLIDLLDIIDHAGPGRQLLGDDVLFESTAVATSPLVGGKTARGLDPFLAPTAHLRLLGCSTAAATPGRETIGRLLLYKLGRALGPHRTVFGTLRPTHAPDFKPGRLSAVREREILYSSHVAVDRETAPEVEARVFQLAVLDGE
jgi:hypothetical protein